MEGLTYLHTIAGGGGLISGAVACFARKGSLWHRRAGNLFLVTMLPMALTGAYLAYFKPEFVSVIAGLLTAYLVATSWSTARRPAQTSKAFDIVALAVAAATTALAVYWGWQAVASDDGMLHGFPAPVYFVFAAIAGLAAVLDLRFVIARGLRGTARISRHLWRMLTALFIAATSFFIGQMDELPVAMQRIEFLVIPPILTLVYLLFWSVRVWFVKPGRPARDQQAVRGMKS